LFTCGFALDRRTEGIERLAAEAVVMIALASSTEVTAFGPGAWSGGGQGILLAHH